MDLGKQVEMSNERGMYRKTPLEPRQVLAKTSWNLKILQRIEETRDIRTPRGKPSRTSLGFVEVNKNYTKQTWKPLRTFQSITELDLKLLKADRSKCSGSEIWEKAFKTPLEPHQSGLNTQDIMKIWLETTGL
jgi:hypothetical protein